MERVDPDRNPGGDRGDPPDDTCLGRVGVNDHGTESTDLPIDAPERL